MTALESFLTNPFIQRVGWALLHFLWQGSTVAIILALVLLLGRRSSNLRYLAACAAMALMLLLP
ncbi:MAG: hypothetical protein K8R91_06220, partial [Phycisphaerae bacterium]|nr:hypothetical protein [Phycisphaerae bacterium]